MKDSEAHPVKALEPEMTDERELGKTIQKLFVAVDSVGQELAHQMHGLMARQPDKAARLLRATAAAASTATKARKRLNELAEKRSSADRRAVDRPHPHPMQAAMDAWHRVTEEHRRLEPEFQAKFAARAALLRARNAKEKVS